MDAIKLYYLSHFLYRLKVPIIPKIIQLIIFILFNSHIPYKVKIGKGAQIGHRGIGVVINDESIIGENVLIRAHVSIGKKKSNQRAPVIGNNVKIGDGAKIIGDIRVGNNVEIGVNALVITDIPDNAIVYSTPAKIKARADI